MVLKVNVDFGFFPDALSSPSSLAGEGTVLNINIRLELSLGTLMDKQRVDIESIYRNVGSVRLPYLLVKNFNTKSKLVIDARQTQSFAVKKNNFENIVNMVYANR